VKGILADANIIGPIEALVNQMQSGTWAEFWTALGLEFKRFGDVGLSPDASDLVIWQTCQAEQLILITDNRN
jgi:predicted nuclease of predicted toxin-antitoxin system